MVCQPDFHLVHDAHNYWKLPEPLTTRIMQWNFNKFTQFQAKWGWQILTPSLHLSFMTKYPWLDDSRPDSSLHHPQSVICASFLGLWPAAVFGRASCANDITRAGLHIQFYEEGGSRVATVLIRCRCSLTYESVWLWALFLPVYSRTTKLLCRNKLFML